MVPLGTFASYTLYGADVASYAGQVVELGFTQLGPRAGIPPPGGLLVDSIVFSPELIPEPSSLGLLTAGLLFLGWQRFRKRA